LTTPSRKPSPRQLPLRRGLLRITGDTLEGPSETDSFDIVSGAEGEVGVVLLDVQTRHRQPSVVSSALLKVMRRALLERTPLHAICLDVVRGLFEFPSTEVRLTLLRFSPAPARVEVIVAGMPPVACALPDGGITVHAQPAPPLTSTTTLPPPVEVVPLVWGSTWLAVSDGFTSGSAHPDAVRRLADELGLDERGMVLSAQTPDALYDLLASRLAESGRFARDDATLVLVSADPNARYDSGFERMSKDEAS
jgi:serine phosphatase RsbU (regulator of sigma subunit)